MRIKVRPLNQGERFCCSIKKAKEIFKDTTIYLNFSFLNRTFGTFSETPDAYYVKRNIRGKIIASMYINTRQQEPILSFYALKSSTCSKEMICQFEQICLPEFYRLYQTQMNSKSLTDNTSVMLIELHEEKLTVHEFQV